MIASLLFLFLNVWGGVSARCVMYGDCAVVGGFTKSCPVTHEALPILQNLTQEDRQHVIDTMDTICPHFLYDEDGNQKEDDDIRTCCDTAQLQNMADNLQLAQGVLGRCPVCIRNFARQICEMNCSPEQSRFMNVSQDVTADGTPYVNEIDYRVYDNFMTNAHASCAGVMIPQLGIPAINLMCGNAPVCDADAWLGFTGDTSINPLAPVQVNFRRWPTPEDSMNVKAPLCNETLEGDIPCSCVDCFAKCPVSDVVVPDICKVLSVNCIGFSVGIVFFVITFIFFSIFTIVHYKRTRNIESVKSSNDYSYNVNFLISYFKNVSKNIF